MNKIFTSLKIIFKESVYKKIAFYTILVSSYLSYWLFYKTTTMQTFLQSMKNGEYGEYSVLYGVTYIVSTILIILLSSVSVATAFWLYRHSRLNQIQNITANLGGFTAAAFSMGCPVCGAFLLSAIGIVGGFTIFPLQGLELKFLSLGLLAGSIIYGASKVQSAIHCEDCQNITHRLPQAAADRNRIVVLPVEKIFVFSLGGFFLINQLLMSQIAASFGMTSQSGFVAELFGIKTKSTYAIIAPKVNNDGKTTSLVEWPTITEVLANPNSGDALVDAKVVMIATGKPFYAPNDISFDDPINAQKKWLAFETSIKLSTEQETRYQKLISAMMACSYCCGSPNNVTMNKSCGCAHAKAVRGFYRYMIQNYDDKYSDEELVGESHRWYAIWYPKGMLEDYLLATGNESALPHQSHGGAGSNGRHGL